MRRWLTIPMLLMLVACEGDTRLKSLRDFELAERYATCLDRAPTAPGQMQACENIRRECERRREELGTYVCRTQ